MHRITINTRHAPKEPTDQSMILYSLTCAETTPAALSSATEARRFSFMVWFILIDAMELWAHRRVQYTKVVILSSKYKLLMQPLRILSSFQFRHALHFLAYMSTYLHTPYCGLGLVGCCGRVSGQAYRAWYEYKNICQVRISLCCICWFEIMLYGSKRRCLIV